jgi:hypothetical protein
MRGQPEGPILGEEPGRLSVSNRPRGEVASGAFDAHSAAGPVSRGSPANSRSRSHTSHRPADLRRRQGTRAIEPRAAAVLGAAGCSKAASPLGDGKVRGADQHRIVHEMDVARLLFVASVEESRKLVCQAPGCGRAIAKAVHVIRDQTGTVCVVGSGCYGKLSGHERATEDGAAIAGFDGRRLTPEERTLMAADTAAFVAGVEARLAAEREAAQQAEEMRRAEAQRLREQHAASGLMSLEVV